MANGSEWNVKSALDNSQDTSASKYTDTSTSASFTIPRNASNIYFLDVFVRFPDHMYVGTIMINNTSDNIAHIVGQGEGGHTVTGVSYAADTNTLTISLSHAYAVVCLRQSVGPKVTITAL